MENIKIYELINSEIAIDVNEAEHISNIIIKKFSKTHSKVCLDFSWLTSIISPFTRALIKPLLGNKVDFEGTKFENDRLKDSFERILEGYKVMWMENIREVA